MYLCDIWPETPPDTPVNDHGHEMTSDIILNEIITELSSFFHDKVVLEAACGSGNFAIGLKNTARKVIAIDVSVGHVYEQNMKDGNVEFLEMNASAMGFDGGCFHTIVFFNALAHIKKDLNGILRECLRILKKEGSIIFISTWKLDYALHDLISAASTVGIQADQETKQFRATIAKKPSMIQNAV